MAAKDLFQWVGNDLELSASGGLRDASGVLKSNQRIARRLLTNPGEYIYHPEYGAGLPSHIGKNTTKNELKAIILGQVLLEDSVSKSVQPIITLSDISGTGNLSIDVLYAYAETGELTTVTIAL